MFSSQEGNFNVGNWEQRLFSWRMENGAEVAQSV
jgi:hypothetical protein